MILTQSPIPAYTVNTSFAGDAVFLPSSDSDVFDILQEDALVTYTGALFASTSGNNNQAVISLAATVQDIADGFTGNISNAKVQFYNAETNTPIGGPLDVQLVNANDPTVGTVQYDWTVTLSGNTDWDSYEVGIQVIHYYTRDYEADDALITVSKPLNDFFTGGGYIYMEEPEGPYAGDVGTKCHFSVNAKWTPNGNNPKGKFHFLVRRLESDGIVHTYRFKSNSITSIGINPLTDEGDIAGKCSIQDVTDPTNPISLGGNKPFLVEVQDNGEPGTLDNIAITVYNNNGGSLLFSSYWNGVQTVYDLLDAGNLQVHYGNQAIAVLPDNGPAQHDELLEHVNSELTANLFPNPAHDEIHLVLSSPESQDLRMEVVGADGRTVRVAEMFVMEGENNLRIDLNGTAPGVYWVRITGKEALITKQFIRVSE